MKKPIKCSNCNKVFHVSEKKLRLKKVRYCSVCIKKYGYKALKLQEEFGGYIEDLIVEGAINFKRLDYVADSLGVSYNTLVRWIRKFFLVDDVDFRRLIICRSPGCSVVKVNKGYRFRFISKIKGKACYLCLRQKYFCVSLGKRDLENLLKEDSESIKIL